MGFSRQEHWSGQPFTSPGDLPNPGVEPASPALTDGSFTTEPPGSPALFSPVTFCLWTQVFVLLSAVESTAVL